MKKVFLIAAVVILGLVAWWQFGNKTVVENFGNELEKADLIRLDTPRPNQVINSPLTIKGEARGTWYFEASFPVILTNWDGLIIAQGIATAKSDWMTTEFVPFEATLNFTVDKNAYSNRGSLILRKDNPSGLPEHDDALEIPVLIF
ncbi:MAG: Gmad2 immunoglobulin-like domain-containing protein [bacterium]|nr:Gmad2 immunoglobulin-like domain-containing protein [bacterium]